MMKLIYKPQCPILHW